MTDQQAYRRYTAEAVRLLELARYPQALVTTAEPISEAEAERIKAELSKVRVYDVTIAPPAVHIDFAVSLQAAAVWATLALAAAQDRVIPADRPIDDDSEQCPGCGSLRKGTHGAHRNTDSAGVCWNPWHDS